MFIVPSVRFSIVLSLFMYIATSPVQLRGSVCIRMLPVRLMFCVNCTFKCEVILATLKVVVAFDGAYLLSPG